MLALSLNCSLVASTGTPAFSLVRTKQHGWATFVIRIFTHGNQKTANRSRHHDDMPLQRIVYVTIQPERSENLRNDLVIQSTKCEMGGGSFSLCSMLLSPFVCTICLSFASSFFACLQLVAGFPISFASRSGLFLGVCGRQEGLSARKKQNESSQSYFAGSSYLVVVFFLHHLQQHKKHTFCCCLIFEAGQPSTTKEKTHNCHHYCYGTSITKNPRS
jgi:hypothetical protein